jgi:DNA-binding beta-propeller fold protein YncE
VVYPLILFLSFFFSNGGEKKISHFGTFELAAAISVDNAGNIFVLDKVKNSFQKFSIHGDSLGEFGSIGWGNLQFDSPRDIWVKNSLDIFVADYNNHRIQRFNRKLNYIATLFTRDDESSITRFGYPTSVATNSKGELFVCDGENKRIIKFSSFEKAEIAFGGFDAGKGKLRSPIQIEIDSADRIFVLENNRILSFDAFGNYLRTFGEDILNNATGFTVYGDDILVANRNELALFSLDGDVLGTFPLSNLLPDESADEEVIDIAVWKNTMYLLTPHSVNIVNP